MIYIDPSGHITVGLRDSIVLSRGDSISWDSSKGIATATINGVTQSFTVGADSNVWIENGRIMMDQKYFYVRFGSVSKVVTNYIASHLDEMGYAKDDPVGNFLIDTAATVGLGTSINLAKNAFTKVGKVTIKEVGSSLPRVNIQLFAKKGDIKQIESVAKYFKMTPQQRRAFGDYVESLKDLVPNNKNFSYQQLKEIAKEFLGVN